ncbi:hypothetical protein, partial [Enterococcus faecalis]|uniref:hypothetical protein n=1 Tax=Enterococcus faecalis TaxID=1351 RepID=UPI001EE8DF38
TNGSKLHFIDLTEVHHDDHGNEQDQRSFHLNYLEDHFSALLTPIYTMLLPVPLIKPLGDITKTNLIKDNPTVPKGLKKSLSNHSTPSENSHT